MEILLVALIFVICLIALNKKIDRNKALKYFNLNTENKTIEDDFRLEVESYRRNG